MLVPKGYSFAALSAGFKKNGAKTDLGLVVSSAPAATAATFTTNLFPAAPVQVARELIKNNTTARAVMMNSGQANACTGEEGMANCRATLEMAAKALAPKAGAITPDDILPGSTGVIGPQLHMDKWAEAIPLLAERLGRDKATDFARAIMTTDRFAKIAWREIVLDGKSTVILGMAKGAGMICPNMATMLSVLLTDAAVAPELWRPMLKQAIEASFNRATVDGDTSTNDTVYGLANGESGLEITDAAPDTRDAFQQALTQVCAELAYMLVQDGEGAEKVMHITVTGAKDDAQAELAARAVGNSPLVKTAIFGRDPNWGRIVGAVGRSGAQFDPDQVSLAMFGVLLFENGTPSKADFDSILKARMEDRDIPVHISLGSGPGEYFLLASDLGHGYININADYRS